MCKVPAKDCVEIVTDQSRTVAQIEEELAVTDKLLRERDRVMEAIPPCPIHGNQCVPYALAWIEEQKAR